MEKRNRPSWEQYAMLQAFAAATRSEDPYTQVGACALSADHRVIATSYNGLAAGKNVPLTFWENRDSRRPYMLHAEVNLTSLFKGGEVELVAITMLPCSSCAQLLAAHKVKKIVYCQSYNRDTKGLDILSFYGIEVRKIFPSEIEPYVVSMSNLLQNG
jgi:dCMP deaminase